MNPLVRQWINYKINNLTTLDLIKLGKVYNIHLTKVQAKKVIEIINKQTFDIGNKQQTNKILIQIGTDINKEIEKKIRYLIEVLM